MHFSYICSVLIKSCSGSAQASYCYFKCIVSYAVFFRLNAAAFIEFLVIQVRRLFEGGVHFKSNLLLANNSMVIEYLNFKKTETCLSSCLKSHFPYLFQFHKFSLRRLFEGGVYSREAFNRINTVCDVFLLLKCIQNCANWQYSNYLACFTECIKFTFPFHWIPSCINERHRCIWGDWNQWSSVQTKRCSSMSQQPLYLCC